MPFVYILESIITNKHYIGSTRRTIYQRLCDHNAGRVVSTRTGKLWRLVLFQEFKTYKDARLAEFRLKKYKNRRIIERIIKDGFIKIAK